MNKSVAEKAVDGALLDSLGDPKYFVLISAFSLYWDWYLQITTGGSLLSLSYQSGQVLPIGSALILVASFSLLAAMISPMIFWVCNRLFWEVWCYIPTSKNVRYSDYTPLSKLELWAVKQNNSVAMAAAKDRRAADQEIDSNRAKPFLLALCIATNYFYAKNGVLRFIEKTLPDDYQFLVFWGIVIFAVFLAYASFTAIPEEYYKIYLPGLGEHIEFKGDSDKGAGQGE